MKTILAALLLAGFASAQSCPNGTVGGYQGGTPYNYVDSVPYCAWWAVLQPFSQTRTYFPNCADGSAIQNGSPNPWAIQATSVAASGTCGLAFGLASIPVCHPVFVAGPVTTVNPGAPGYQYVGYSSFNVLFIGFCVKSTSGGAQTVTCGTACLSTYDPDPPPQPDPVLPTCNGIVQPQAGCQGCWVCSFAGWVCYVNTEYCNQGTSLDVGRPRDGYLHLQLKY